MNNQIKNSHFIGIDLGTTFTVFAFYDDTGKPKVIPNMEGDQKTPSVVNIGKNGQEILAGTAAYNMQLIDPEHTVSEFKRDVGTDKVYFRTGKIDVTPQYCQTIILKYVRSSAIKYFNDDRAASQAVITVPAYFGEKERQSVKQSGEMAGMEILGLINEPTAAGLAFGVSEKQGDRQVLIGDFGGGTYDASIIIYSGGQANVLGSKGDKHLGGKDVDDALLLLIQEAFKKEHGLDFTPKSHPADWFSAKEMVIREKHMLAARNEVKLASRVDGKQVVVHLTRDAFHKLLEPLMKRVEKVTLDAFTDAKVNIADVKHVLLVGGSSRLLAFQDRIKRIFTKNVIMEGAVSPDLAIAEGAIIHAARLINTSGVSMVNNSLQAIPAPSIKYTDVMPHSLGIAVQDRVSATEYCSVLLPRNTPIPQKQSKVFGSVEDSQRLFKITVVQGEESQPIEDCLVVGERELELPPRSHMEASIQVDMEYDSSGMVRIFVTDKYSTKPFDITVNYYAKK
jgi:molecular chaperone HscC